MSAPLVGHLDPIFVGVMDDVQQLLRYLFETNNRIAVPISGTEARAWSQQSPTCLNPVKRL
jgi:alanine-glyoxylate transaminase/serine-glyoxylate transaminase/serine-pyruvate transaminase